MPAHAPPLRGSLRLGVFAGIGVYVHWTFFLLPAALAAARLMAEGDLATRATDAAVQVALILSVFTCVLLHEFGHALTARRYGVKTRDIVLLPIGGVARLERNPRNPIQELWIALAGPAVNLVIAAILGLIVAAAVFLGADPSAALATQGVVGFLAALAFINIALIVFNMIPAFPMDGGRVLRALLALRMEYGRATVLAARVGQFVALCLVLVGIATGHYLLLIIAAMVFLGAGAEARHAVTISRLMGVTVREAMMTDLRSVREHEPLSACSELLLAGPQSEFPVISSGPEAEFRGLITRQRLLSAIELGRESDPAASIAQRDLPAFAESDNVVDVFENMQELGISAAPVLRDGRFAGIITADNIADVLQIRDARSAAAARIAPA